MNSPFDVERNIEMIGCICPSPHLKRLKEIKQEMKNCKVYVEIGVLYGGSMIMMMDMQNEECLHIGIDPFSGYYGSTYDPHRKIDLTNHYDIVNDNIKKNNKYFHKWKLIKGSSYDINTANQVKEIIDFLFIDGDHSYSGVLADFYHYKDKVRKGGIIAFDNYADSCWPEVKPAVDKIVLDNKDYYKVKETCGNCLVLEKL